MEKVVYRCLSGNEVLDMINPSNRNYDRIKNHNTFNYENDINYKHFFIFENHAEIFIPKYKDSLIGVFAIKEELIDQMGYGFYSNVKTKNNSKLGYMEIPIPELIVREENFNKESLIRLYNPLQNELYYGQYDNPFERKFIVDDGVYSYADIYYEIICDLLYKHNMNMNEIVEYLQKIDIKNEIENFFVEKKKKKIK